MQLTKKQYQSYIMTLQQKSTMGKDLLLSFLIGGAICTLGQGIRNLWDMAVPEESAKILTSVTLIALSAVLTGFSLYDDVAKFAGAGTIVPITGFANAVVSCAIEFKSEGFVTGMAAKMFIIAGPVIVFGTLAGTAYGIVYYFLGVL